MMSLVLSGLWMDKGSVKLSGSLFRDWVLRVQDCVVRSGV